MNINYFGEIAEITNKTTETVDLKTFALFELLDFLQSTYNLNLDNIHIAINHDIVQVDSDMTLKNSDEIAILSPFAGG